jgi:pentatricopeptide repeat protein
MVKECLRLLEEPNIEQSVRRGDLLAIIIEYHFEMEEYEKCLQYLKLMKEKGIIITPYIDK